MRLWNSIGGIIWPNLFAILIKLGRSIQPQTLLLYILKHRSVLKIIDSLFHTEDHIIEDQLHNQRSLDSTTRSRLHILNTQTSCIISWAIISVKRTSYKDQNWLIILLLQPKIKTQKITDHKNPNPLNKSSKSWSWEETTWSFSCSKTRFVLGDLSEGKRSPEFWKAWFTQLERFFNDL